MLKKDQQKGSLPPENVNLLETLILSCDEPVRRLARTYAWDAHDVDADDLYMAGMTEVREWAERAYVRATNPTAYLCRAAQHAMLAELKGIHDHPPVSLDAPLSDEHAYCLTDLLAAPCLSSVSPAPSPAVQALRSAMQQLSPRQRNILHRLYDFSGCHIHLEVGRELGIGRSTVNSHAVIARKRLRTDSALCKAPGVEPLLNVVKSQKVSTSMQTRSEYAL